MGRVLTDQSKSSYSQRHKRLFILSASFPTPPPQVFKAAVMCRETGTAAGQRDVR